VRRTVVFNSSNLVVSSRLTAARSEIDADQRAQFSWFLVPVLETKLYCKRVTFYYKIVLLFYRLNIVSLRVESSSKI